ncbi:IS110 family transposase [Peribacillus simplex]|uniref:IS110 family transposase n=1 Tax=Peribacillus simplex TaxID=1478 RepID=UPI003B8E9580
MNYNQNHKISQITSETLIVGVDIAKHNHVARAQDFRGLELGKTCFFENTKAGFHSFLDWITQLVKGCKLNQVIVGMEPTGHYWLNLAHLLKENNIKFVSVNPLHVKRSKELDDNSPTKNDVKDAKVIAQLVKDGRYAEPTIPRGIYAELRVAKKLRDLLNVDLQVVQGQVHNWLDRYFPEFLTVFKSWEGKAAMAKLELRALLEKYDFIQMKFEEIDHQLDQLLDHIPGVTQMLEVSGIGRDTVAGFFAEVGDLRDYQHPRQIVKLAGLSLKENTSGKHKGQTKITKRGRKKLRALLFRAAMILVAKNKAFKALHIYYTTRSHNPLKKMQSLIALCNKLIRILFSIGKKQFTFQEDKMLKDIPHMATFVVHQTIA